MSLTKIEKKELKKFQETNQLLSCDIYKDAETLNIWHSLKDKGEIRFRGNQENLQYFQIKE